MNSTSELIKIRRHLHAHPELSGEEYQTANKIADYISRYSPTSIIQHVGGTGVLAIFDSGKKGPTILFRSELDALPIHEVNDFEYRSTIDNISHKCGHDGHSAILVGLAKQLSEKPFKSGKVVLLFQPAEENGQGAKAVLADPKFAGIQPDYVFAFHNLPGYPTGQVVVKRGAFTAAVRSIIIKLHGKTAHAAEPEYGTNPALAIAEILTQTNLLSNNQPEREDFAVVTPIHIDMGKIYYGISAGYGELRFTIRAWTEEHLSTLINNILDGIETVSKKYNINTEVEWTHEFVSNLNHSEAVDLISKSALELQTSIIERAYPFKWGEDFGLFTQQFKGAMFGIGAGEDIPALHNPDYDFPDEIIPTGVQLFYTIASKILQ